MRRILGTMLAALALGSSAWPFTSIAPIVDPETECRAAVRFLETLPPDERLYARFFSTYSVPAKERDEFETLMRLAIRQVTLSPNRKTVPLRASTSPTLFWMDLRSFLWNADAWRAIALRDKTFREPWIKAETAQRVRFLIGETQPQNFHAVAVVDAWGLYRRIYQSTETPSYYDLLFAEQRYPAPGIEQADRRVPTPKAHPVLGVRSYAAPARKFVDFPQNDEEWLSAFLGGVGSKEYKDAITRLKSRRGAVINGMTDAGKEISIVARNNREVHIESAFGRFSGLFGRTFDQKESSGRKDVAENAFTDQAQDKNRVTFDGGELLYTLPAGDGVASLLINAQGKRVEEVPPDIAVHTRDIKDKRVRNGALACYACHGDGYGWMPLANIIEKDSPKEIDVRFKKKEDAEDYQNFFIGWSHVIKASQDVTKENWRQLTGWDGAKVAQLTLSYKNRYDEPVDAEQAARELGVTPEQARAVAGRSVLRRAIDLARGGTIPRPAWDSDIFPVLQELLHSAK